MNAMIHELTTEELQRVSGGMGGDNAGTLVTGDYGTLWEYDGYGGFRLADFVDVGREVNGG